MSEARKSHDILKTDTGFLEFVGSLVFGLGLFILILRLFCSIFSLEGLCMPGFFPFPVIEQYFKPTFFSFVIPLSMVIFGVGLGMFTRTGWFAAQLMLLFHICLFGFSCMILGQFWAHAGPGFAYKLPLVLHACLLLWASIFFFYLFSGPARRLYFT